MANTPARLQSLKPKFVESMPRVKEHGILYVCHKYKLAIHLCACGCGSEAVTSIAEGDWTLFTIINLDDTKEVTLTPSIGNWGMPCRSHYYITKNQVEWL